MTKLLDTSGEGGGLVDVSYRQLQPATTDTAYTWWSNRGQAYANNVGWRLITTWPHLPWRHWRAQSPFTRARSFRDHAPITVEYEFAPGPSAAHPKDTEDSLAPMHPATKQPMLCGGAFYAAPRHWQGPAIWGKHYRTPG